MAGRDTIINEFRGSKATEISSVSHRQAYNPEVCFLDPWNHSERQVRRLVKVLREEGDSGIIHKSRGVLRIIDYPMSLEVGRCLFTRIDILILDRRLPRRSY